MCLHNPDFELSSAGCRLTFPLLIIGYCQQQQKTTTLLLKSLMTTASKRLQRELAGATKEALYRVAPLETNILNFHFVLRGAPETAYEGGYYHGELKFPTEYPLKPPGILFHTPNGRFEINTRLCFSMSDYHPGTSCCLSTAYFYWRRLHFHATP
jgi:ubiquitin-protein ligase